MPLFLVPIAVGAGAVVIGGYGAKKGYDGVSSLKRANKLGKNAERKHKRHLNILESARQHAGARLSDYDALRQRVREETFGRLIELIERLDQKARVQALDELGELEEFRENVPEFREHGLEYGGAGLGALKGVAAGAGARALVGSAAAQIGSASTGAAISGLSGAAAESATLAWLGGGALSAGGGGMALGTAVLGGVTIAPAIALGGWTLARQGSKALTKATQYEAKVKKAVKRMNLAVGVLHRIETRIEELTSLVERLDARATSALDQLEGSIDDGDTDQQAAGFSLSMLLAKALAQILRAPVLNEDGEPSEESRAVLDEYADLAEADA